MKVLILGGTGMLGHKLVQTLQAPHFETWTSIRGSFSDVEHTGIFRRETTVENVDVTDFDLLRQIIDRVRPHAVINAVGIIKQVPAAQNTAELITINSVLPHVLSQLSAEFGFRLVCISTDCVFSGIRGNYRESDIPDCVDVYGRSKLMGEVSSGNCLTLRTSIIGRELDSSHSLVEWFLGQNGPVRGYSKAVYTGFPTVVFSRIISDLLLNHPELNGILHVSSDRISKLELLRLIDREYKTGREIIPDDIVVTDRSLDSTRFRELTGFDPDPWPEMIRQMAADETSYEQFHRDRKAGVTVEGIC